MNASASPSPARPAPPDGWKPLLAGWLIAWIVVAAVLHVVVPIPGSRDWIELFNGATWPSTLPGTLQDDDRRMSFAAVLAARTLLNLGSAAAGVIAIFWFFVERPKSMQKTAENVRETQYALLQFHLVSFLRDHQGQKVDDELVAQFKSRLQDWVGSELARRLDDEVATLLAETRDRA